MTYKIYYNPDSANLVIRMVLEEMGLQYQDEEVQRKRADRDDSFFRLNPRGLLPVLIDQEEDVAIFETAAILLYLADKHGQLAPKMSQAKARGAFLKWLFMLSNTMHADLRIRFYSERYVMGESDIAPLLEANKRRILGHLELINRVLGENEGEGLLESGLSVCDFYLGCCVRWAQMYPVGKHAIDACDLETFPNLVAKLGKLQELSSVQNALRGEGIGGKAFLYVAPHLSPREGDEIGGLTLHTGSSQRPIKPT